MWVLFCKDDSQWRSFWDGAEGSITWANWSARCAPPEPPAAWGDAVLQQLEAPSISSDSCTTLIWFPPGRKDASFCVVSQSPPLWLHGALE